MAAINSRFVAVSRILVTRLRPWFPLQKGQHDKKWSAPLGSAGAKKQIDKRQHKGAGTARTFVVQWDGLAIFR
jgi:hypothetical protein